MVSSCDVYSERKTSTAPATLNPVSPRHSCAFGQSIVPIHTIVTQFVPGQLPKDVIWVKGKESIVPLPVAGVEKRGRSLSSDIL